MTDWIQFAEETPMEAATRSGTGRKVLIVDDDREMHRISARMLRRVRHRSQELELLHAYSAREALKLMLQHPDIAVLLLDVVMETDSAGLKLAQLIRYRLHNWQVRILLRSGQAGPIGALARLHDLDISACREKTELTCDALLGAVEAELESFEGIQSQSDLSQRQ